MALAGAVSALVAKETGESLQNLTRATGEKLGDHPEDGDTAFLLSVVYAFFALATYVLYEFGETIRDRLNLLDRLRLPVSDSVAAYLVTVPVAIIAVVALIIAGHSGATLAWKDFP